MLSEREGEAPYIPNDQDKHHEMALRLAFVILVINLQVASSTESLKQAKVTTYLVGDKSTNIIIS